MRLYGFIVYLEYVYFVISFPKAQVQILKETQSLTLGILILCQFILENKVLQVRNLSI